jgi:uncharacterized membrane protein
MMDKINWKQKLTSRKFWAAVTGFVTAILMVFKVDEMTIEQVIAMISASSVLIAYIIGEGIVDAARVQNQESLSEIDKL